MLIEKKGYLLITKEQRESYALMCLSDLTSKMQGFEVIVPGNANMEHTIIPSTKAKSRKDGGTRSIAPTRDGYSNENRRNRVVLNTQNAELSSLRLGGFTEPSSIEIIFNKSVLTHVLTDHAHTIVTAAGAAPQHLNAETVANNDDAT
ncbi:hypothetical protein Tco_0394068 [Tanacetum coccineum]